MRRLTLIAIAAALFAAVTANAASPPPALLHPAKLTSKAPASYAVTFTTTKGAFVVTVKRSESPRGADRFYNLVRARFFDGVVFFRVVKGFVVQFGISPYPAVSRAWQNATIRDDPVRGHNTAGTVTFADAGPNTRTTQLFINLANNSTLDVRGFSPIGRVSSGMRVVSALYAGYGEKPSGAQGEIAAQGNAFLKKRFPKLDAIVTARIAG
ncbi:MAG: peptidylprolyl isomerase [Gaiellaceae bacterium]